MQLSIVFAAVAASVALFALFSTSALLSLGSRPTSERGRFWALAAPVLAAGLAFAFFAGWAAQEPDPSDEWVARGLFVPGVIAVLSLARALLRALASLRAKVQVPVATLGIVSPRVEVSETFRAAVGDDVLDAALAHEEAHRRHRDPLRIWLAALAADLQWPIPGAPARFERWLAALEIERDDEALANGASPVALAEAIVVAARLSTSHEGALARVSGSANGLACRVRRLLRGEAQPRRPTRRVSAPLMMAAVSLACWLGHDFGDLLIAILPGVGR